MTARAQTFPEFGILGVRRGRRRARSTTFDVCEASGRKIDRTGGSKARCAECRRVLRVTCRGHLPTHMRTVRGAA